MLLQATNITCLRATGDAYGCMIDQTIAAFGGDAVMGLIVGGMVVLSLYISSSYHPAPPSIGTMLIGGLLIPILPQQHQGTAMVIMLIGFIAGVWVLLRRYVMEVGR
jgi:hypothetical protein